MSADRFVLTAWLAATAAAVGYVARFGVNLPVGDEWAMIDVLTGDRPVLPWLWDWHNEHRLPLPRLVWCGLYRLTGDLRAGMLATVLGLSLTARLLIRVGRVLHGSARYSHSAIPLLLFNLSQGENLLMSYQVGFMLSVLLAAGGLWCQVCVAGRGRWVGVAACGLMLTLCGAHGCLLALGPVVTLLLNRRWVLAAGVAVGVGWYLASYPGGGGWKPSPTVGRFAAGLAAYATVGYGQAGWWAWPVSAVVPLGLCAGAVRKRVGPPTVWLVAAVVLGLAVACGRGPFGAWAVFAPRYVLLAATVPLGFVLLGGRVGTATACFVWLMLPGNLAVGWRTGEHARALHTGVIDDLRSGVPVEVVAERTHFQTFNDPVAFAVAVEGWATSGRAPFDHVRRLPPHRVTCLPPTALESGTDGWWELNGMPEQLLAVRIHGVYANTDPLTPVRVRWADRTDPAVRFVPAVGRVDGKSDSLRFHPGDDWTPKRVELIVAD
jgi:hypothetical protein